MSEFKINAHAFGARGADFDEAMDDMFEILTAVRGVGSVVLDSLAWVDDSPEMRMLGSQAQGDRVCRIMTTLD